MFLSLCPLRNLKVKHNLDRFPLAVCFSCGTFEFKVPVGEAFLLFVFAHRVPFVYGVAFFEAGIDESPMDVALVPAGHARAAAAPCEMVFDERLNCVVEDVLEKLDSVPNKQGYIKQLIRADLKK